MPTAWFLHEKTLSDAITHKYYQLEVPYKGTNQILVSRSDILKSFNRMVIKGVSSNMKSLFGYGVEYMVFGINSGEELYCCRDDDCTFNKCLQDMGYDKIDSYEVYKLNNIVNL